MKALKSTLAAIGGISAAIMPLAIVQAQQVTGTLQREVISAASRVNLIDCVMQPLAAVTQPEVAAQQQMGRFFGVADAELNRFQSSKTVFYQYYAVPAGGSAASAAIPLRLGTAESEIGFSNTETGQTFAFPARIAKLFRACDANRLKR